MKSIPTVPRWSELDCAACMQPVALVYVATHTKRADGARVDLRRVGASGVAQIRYIFNVQFVPCGSTARRRINARMQAFRRILPAGKREK